MPIVLDSFYQIIIPKAVIRDHFEGGEQALRSLYRFDDSTENSEDHELFSIVIMGNPELELDQLEARGLVYDEANKRSEHYVLLSRYAPHWPCDWFASNMVYGWHTDTDQAKIDEAIKRSNTPMDELHANRIEGRPIFETIT